jgi:predicted ArsR family transcriptional regulator
MAAVRGVESDRILKALLVGRGKSVKELASECGLTATGIRHHLSRLMAEGLVRRRGAKGGRGRPRFIYFVPTEVQHRLGNNFADLAVAMWEELGACQDRAFATKLLRQAGDRLGRWYRELLPGTTAAVRAEGLAQLLRQRGVLGEVEHRPAVAVLRLMQCPYQRLAEGDRRVCGIERRMLTAALEANVRLTRCRLDGEPCCEYEVRELTPEPRSI